MATNHGVGGSNPSSPTTGPRGRGKYLSLWGSNDGDSGPKVMELGCRSFVEMKRLFFLFCEWSNHYT